MAFALTGAAFALPGVGRQAQAAPSETRLWTEGTGRAPAGGAVNMQAFSKLARALGPAVVNIVAVQSGEDPRNALERQLSPDGGKPHGSGKGQGVYAIDLSK